MTFEAESPAAGWLLVSEKYFPGWTATVNGKDAPIERANVMFRAVRIGAGRSTVAFAYEPATVTWGWVVSLLGLLGLGAGFVVTRATDAVTVTAGDPERTG